MSNPDLDVEQKYLDLLYHRLDDQRARAAERVAAFLRTGGGTPEARSQRDAAVGLYQQRVAGYDAVEQGLCFGRVDYADGTDRHIGRIGLFDADRDYEPLLLDWRAPAARPFYVATAASPDGVLRRRHIRTQDRTVVKLDDEILDLELAAGTDDAPLTGEAALLAALTARRTGRMRDIVETIQAEQDAVIRSGLDGVLVVQGGPGTGKTAVALHRAAYLLYTHRRTLSSRGVLVVGPNPTFLRYISQVLPSLSETGVLLATLGDLYPGLTARRAEAAAVADVKGRREMAEVLATAVSDRQVLPDQPIPIRVDRETLHLRPSDVAAARLRARRSDRPHNLARPIFVDAVLEALVAEVAEAIGQDPYWDDPLGGDDAPGDPNLLDAIDRKDIRDDLIASDAVQEVLTELWPVLTPQRLLADLFGSKARLASAAPQFSPDDHALLYRLPGGGWSPADVPLLDEAAELLGEDDSSERARAELLRRASLDYAQGLLDISAGSILIDFEDDPEAAIPNIVDLMDADAVAERYANVDQLGAAARAAADRRWAFGHIIVDEAQELSPMAWRLLMRRCPSRSMTVVGDLAQTGALSGPATWAELFAPFVADRWRLAELSVSYRTPAEIMAVAARALPEVVMPRAVRESGIPPWDESGPLSRLSSLVAAESEAVGHGRLAVIAPASRVPELAAQLPVGTDLEDPVVLLTVAEAKGLEFDGVVVVDPDGIVAGSARGANDLYVALTRSTQRLGVFRPA